MRNERGITLFVLIVTIVLTLILAGVVITFALGDRGLLKNTSRAEIMGKVQALDDSVKAYTLKSDDPYSSSKKTIDDLIKEGILTKIKLIGDDASSDKDDKTIYCVNFGKVFEDGTTKDIATMLGLTKGEYKNLTQLPNEPVYKNLDELKDLGIYVVDNDLNAAYLKDNQVYGTLVNFGEKDVVEVASKFKSQTLQLIIDNGVVQSIPEQEVILIIDITCSMILDMDGDANNRLPYYSNNLEKGFKETRWYATTQALDAFLDAYFENAENSKRSVTIYTFAGSAANTQTKQYNDITRICYKAKTKAEAKASYENIFTYKHYENIIKYINAKRSGNLKNSIYYGIGPKDPNNNNYGNYGQYVKNYCVNTLKQQDFTDPQFFPSTCAPNALHEIYKVLTAAKDNGTVQKDVIMLTDGESNESWGTFNGSSINTTTSLGYIGQAIRNMECGGRKVGVYAVGVSSSISDLTKYFNNKNTKGADQVFQATQAAQIVDGFQKILENINTNSTVETNANNSHSLMALNMDTKQVEEFKIEGAKQIVLELIHTSDPTKKVTLTFKKGGNGKDGIYALDKIYDTEGHIKLENAWTYSSIPPGELTFDYSKIITVYTTE